MACDFAVNALNRSFFDRPALHKSPRSAKIKPPGPRRNETPTGIATCAPYESALGEGTQRESFSAKYYHQRSHFFSTHPTAVTISEQMILPTRRGCPRDFTQNPCQ